MQDAMFDSEVIEAQKAGLDSLKCEMKSVERIIEKFLTQLLECSSLSSERDFHVLGI